MPHGRSRTWSSGLFVLMDRSEGAQMQTPSGQCTAGGHHEDNADQQPDRLRSPVPVLAVVGQQIGSSGSF
jgi:hypothetical protein